MENVVDSYLDSLVYDTEVFQEVFDNPYEEAYDADNASETDYE